MNQLPACSKKVVTKRLTQQIEMLRQSLEPFQHLDSVGFAAIPGTVLLIVTTMPPPGKTFQIVQSIKLR